MKPKDRDFIETKEGHLFCVVDYLHPPHGYTAYLKYIPVMNGKWRGPDTSYSRTLPYYHVSQIENTYKYLKTQYPEYIYDDPVRNITISTIPKTSVKTYYHPQKRVQQIQQDTPNDPLEQKLVELVSLLEEKTGTEDCFGVTGSILTATHNQEFSDIDLTVNGLENSVKLRQAIIQLKEESEQIQPSSREEVERWVKIRADRFPLNEEELIRVAGRRWNFGYFDGTYFSVHPTRLDEEIIEEYGDNTYHRVGEVMGTATVVDASESLFLPAIYKVKDAEINSNEVISEVVSFEGMYGELFENGEKIRFRGILEEVKGKDARHRVIVGGARFPDGYIKWG